MNNIHVVMIDSKYLKSVSSFDNLNNMNFQSEQQVWDYLTNSDYYDDDTMEMDDVNIRDVTYVLTMDEFRIDYNDSEASQYYISFITIDGH